ncbi:rRNA maturation RNAse YbeY [Candidatus Berkelbacteria bacterium]|nr:rRNA maturation RNAse YbeY [Candidatus Berkelbacteria bacterium]
MKISGITLLIQDDTNSIDFTPLIHELKNHPAINSRLTQLAETKPTTLELLFVTKEKIQTLNRDFRLANTSTDVLSFPTYSFRSKQPAKALLAGSIVIAPSQTNHPFMFLIHHSLGHLLGRHHPE